MFGCEKSLYLNAYCVTYMWEISLKCIKDVYNALSFVHMKKINKYTYSTIFFPKVVSL